MSSLPKPDSLRLFVAIAVPAQIKTEIERVQAALRQSLKEGSVRWTTGEQFHLTLKFLGSVEAARLPALTESLRIAGQDFAPLTLRAEQVGFFPDGRFPRVIWLGIHEPTGELLRLQQAVESAVSPFTSEAAEKKFHEHITLGRVKRIRRSSAAVLAQQAARLSVQSFGVWTAEQFELMHSETLPEGARHTQLAAVRFRLAPFSTGSAVIV